jgi:hypothetical protein
MSTIELRKKLHEYINSADDRVLRIMSAVFESYTQSEEEIVAYTVEGKPLSHLEYMKDIQEAEDELKRGEYITHEDLKSEVNSWRE